MLPFDFSADALHKCTFHTVLRLSLECVLHKVVKTVSDILKKKVGAKLDTNLVNVAHSFYISFKEKNNMKKETFEYRREKIHLNWIFRLKISNKTKN